MKAWTTYWLLITAAVAGEAWLILLLWRAW